MLESVSFGGSYDGNGDTYSIHLICCSTPIQTPSCLVIIKVFYYLELVAWVSRTSAGLHYYISYHEQITNN